MSNIEEAETMTTPMDHPMDENDLTDEKILDMWEEGEPTKLASSRFDLSHVPWAWVEQTSSDARVEVIDVPDHEEVQRSG